MANQSLFQSIRGKLLPSTDTCNEALAPAYAFEPKHALAQYAVTGCMNQTFYASAGQQLAKVVALCEQVEPEFIARTALYARRQGYMKDVPALLCAVLSVKSPGLLAEVFDRVIDQPKMLRNFVQIMRSGVVGRKSLGSLPKRLVQQWLEQRSDEQLFVGSVGNNPSLADIIKMVHPHPSNDRRAALYAYLIGRPHDASQLPVIVQQFEAYKQAEDRLAIETPDVPFQLLAGLELQPWEWKAIARHASWQVTRMNLNTFSRHGVLDDRQMVRLIADKLRDPKQLAKARALPYQLLAAYGMTIGRLPGQISEALQDAMEIAIANVPKVEGQVYVLPDISGSMHSPVTGYRKGATTAVRCIDVAALVAAALLRKNPRTQVIAFESNAVPVTLNPRDSVMTNAQTLASLPCGGTNCSAPLAYLNQRKAQGDLVVYVSDNESWLDAPHYGYWGGSPTQTMKQWSLFKARNPQAKMVCIDVQPYGHTQARERPDVYNVGGFSDQVFAYLADIVADRADAGYWVRQIEQVRL